METKVCKDCGRELPLEEFRISKWGGRFDSCNDCIKDKLNETRAKNRGQIIGGGKSSPLSDPDFDGKDPGDIIRMMGRAQRWLQSRGFTIRLDGEYTKTTVHKLKFL